MTIGLLQMARRTLLRIRLTKILLSHCQWIIWRTCWTRFWDCYVMRNPNSQRWQQTLRQQNDLGATSARAAGSSAEEEQAHFDGVQRFLHMLAHMLHNVSDFIVEASQPAPRHLLVMSEVPMHQLHLRINVDSRNAASAGAGAATHGDSNSWR